MAEWKDIGSKAKNLTLAGLDNVSEEENKKRVYVEIAKRFVEENPTAPVGYEDLYDQLAAVEARIQANKERLGQLKD